MVLQITYRFVVHAYRSGSVRVYDGSLNVVVGFLAVSFALIS